MPEKTKVIYQNGHPYFKTQGKNQSELRATDIYGLPTVEEIYKKKQSLPNIPKQSNIQSYQDLENWWKKNQDQNGNIPVTTDTGAHVALNKDLLKHMGKIKQKNEKRYELIAAILQALQSPDEVWQNFHRSKQ